MHSLREKVLASLPSAYREADAPGLALLGRARDAEPLQVELGKASIEHDGPFTIHTLSHVASLTKQFTAYVIAQLIQEGRLSSDTKASAVLPDFPSCGEDITVDHLVHHTSGLRDQWDLLLMAGWRLDDVITTDHIWKVISAQQALNFEPGSEMLYSNSGYSVLAKIIEHATGEAFPDVVRERITKPLGLSRTFALVDHRTIVKGRSFGYRLLNGGFVRSDHSFANTGATSLFSSASELLQWSQHQNELALADSSLGRMLHTPAKLRDGQSIEYAYGARMAMETPSVVMHHDGWDAGYRAAIVRIPSEQIAVTIVTNALDVSAIQVAFDAVEVLVGTDVYRPERVRKIGKKDSSTDVVQAGRRFTESALQGVYRSRELSTEYEVQQRSDGRLLLAHRRHPTHPLAPASDPASYTGPNWMPHLTFEGPSAGQVDGFVVKTDRIRSLPFAKVS